MNISAYYNFEVLARDLNMTRTAQKLGITQQALSAQIARLEKHYQVQLLTREPRLELTYAGRKLLEFCKQLNTWSAQVTDELQEIRDGERGRIFIGATAKRGFSILPMLFPPFNREYPHIEVCMVEGPSPTLIQDLLEERTDFCIVVTQTGDPSICSIPLMEERTLLFISDEAMRKYCSVQYDYLLANKAHPQPIEFFKNCPFILNSTDNRVRKKCDYLFAVNNIIPNIILSSTNAMNLAEITSQGCGATFLNSSTRADSVRGLHRFLIQDLSDPQTLKISYLRQHHLSRPARRFIELARELLPQNTALPQSTIDLL